MLSQFIIFCGVGVITTLIDFAVFNLLTRQAAGWKRIPANIVSVTTAMAWSFLANWFLVFHPDGHAWMQRAGRFLVTTAFSAFVLQNAILYLTTYVWTGPSNAMIYLAGKISLLERFNKDVISRNTCKALAVSAGLIWNFYWYKYFVYT